MTDLSISPELNLLIWGVLGIVVFGAFIFYGYFFDRGHQRK